MKKCHIQKPKKRILCIHGTVYNYFILFCATVKTITPLGAVDDPMHCCPRPKAKGNSVSGHPQHQGDNNFVSCTERYERIVVLSVAHKGIKKVVLLSNSEQHKISAVRC